MELPELSFENASEGRKNDGGKRRMDLIPPEAMEALADVLTMGAAKYADRNWEKGFAWGRSIAALLRHLWAWVKGEDKDPESGLSHMAHVLCNAAFLVTFEARRVGTVKRMIGKAQALGLCESTRKPQRGIDGVVRNVQAYTFKGVE